MKSEASSEQRAASSKSKILIAPSILSADFAKLGEEIEAVKAGGADWLHVDVMDGHFVPNLTIGPAVVAAVKRVTSLPLEVHLMITDPDRYLRTFVDSGASLIIVHAEVLPHLQRTLQEIRRLGARAGVALNPSTPLVAMENVMADLDLLLVMSVNPGFGGQSFIPHTFDKLAAARARLAARGCQAAVEVDGGVTVDNAAALVRSGVSILVAGSSIFGAPDATAAVRALREAAQRA